MIPKSTVKLTPGDYCLIKRDDGKYVPLVYLFSPAKKRSSFYGGLVNCLIDDTADNCPNNLSIVFHALLHISSYKENNTPILGNILPKLDSKKIALMEKEANELKVGYKNSAWGHRTIYKYANQIQT